MTLQKLVLKNPLYVYLCYSLALPSHVSFSSSLRIRLADESRVSTLKDQLNLPENHAGKPVKVVDSDSSSKQSENVAPLVAGKSLAGEAAPGVPVFTFSKTSFSAM